MSCILTYHSLDGEGADLLDGPRGPLLEADAMYLLTSAKPWLDYIFFLSLPSDAIAALDIVLVSFRH